MFLHKLNINPRSLSNWMMSSCNKGVEHSSCNASKVRLPVSQVLCSDEDSYCISHPVILDHKAGILSIFISSSNLLLNLDAIFSISGELISTMIFISHFSNSSSHSVYFILGENIFHHVFDNSCINQ